MMLNLILRPVTSDSGIDRLHGADNPGRFDAVNVYGDESLASNNERNSFTDVKFNDVPGLGIFYRPGYRGPIVRWQYRHNTMAYDVIFLEHHPSSKQLLRFDLVEEAVLPIQF